MSRPPRTYGYETDALAQPDEAWQTLTYCARAKRLAPGERPSSGRGGPIDMVGPDGVARHFRVVYIYGSEEAGAARPAGPAARPAEDALAGIERGLTTKPRQTPSLSGAGWPRRLLTAGSGYGCGPR